MSVLDQLRDSFQFHLEPMNPGDQGEAFACFLNFASSDTAMALELQAQYARASNLQPCNDTAASDVETGRFIDWLIVNVWGQADGPKPH